MMFNKL